MSDASNENEMDTPATQRQLKAVEQTLLAQIANVEVKIEAKIDAKIEGRLASASADIVQQMRSLNEDLFSRVKALFDPYLDVPRRMTGAEARLDALEQPPMPRKPARRRSS